MSGQSQSITIKNPFGPNIWKCYHADLKNGWLKAALSIFSHLRHQKFNRRNYFHQIELEHKSEIKPPCITSLFLRAWAASLFFLEGAYAACFTRRQKNPALGDKKFLLIASGKKSRLETHLCATADAARSRLCA